LIILDLSMFVDLYISNLQANHLGSLRHMYEGVIGSYLSHNLTFRDKIQEMFFIEKEKFIML